MIVTPTSDAAAAAFSAVAARASSPAAAALALIGAAIACEEGLRGSMGREHVNVLCALLEHAGGILMEHGAILDVSEPEGRA